MVTREWLLQELNKYREQMNSALNTANANAGAIEAIESVLKKLAEEDDAEIKKAE